MQVLGVDVGGSGIKGALVDVSSGQMVTDRCRLPTPQPARPDVVVKTIKKIRKYFNYRGPVGVGFPAVVLDGVVLSAANVDDAWIGYPGQGVLTDALGGPVTLLNDADAAGFAEMMFGAGRERKGLVMILTLGTGIGSALFMDGHLVPNCELGHLYLPGHAADAEEYASDRIRSAEDLGWKGWARRLNIYLRHLEGLFSPNLFILGGGVSKKAAKFLPHLTLRTEVVPALLRNEAGIIGAAMAAVDAGKSPDGRQEA
ncbi:MAG: ROK family protein [Chloroflexota bacterium]|nr:MAG: ROK family protein [Chloroflexota bacterium]